MAQIDFRAMGCQILAILEAPGSAAAAALAAVPSWFAGWEQALSRFRANSELATLNRRAGTGWTLVGPALLEVIAAALEAARASDGLVTPTLLGALEQAGYDRDFATLGGGATSAQQGSPRSAASDWQMLRLDRRRRAVALPRGMRLDLGGVAKGWAADQAARRLQSTGPALVNAGGDIAISGPRADGSPWPIAVADPRRTGVELDLLLIHSGGVATSGRDYRHWCQDGVERHHIIDPRSGAPAVTDLLSVTVVAPSAQEAEVAAKAALILGRTAGLNWLAARPHLAALLVAEDGQVMRTASLEAYCWQQ